MYGVLCIASSIVHANRTLNVLQVRSDRHPGSVHDVFWIVEHDVRTADGASVQGVPRRTGKRLPIPFLLVFCSSYIASEFY